MPRFFLFLKLDIFFAHSKATILILPSEDIDVFIVTDMSQTCQSFEVCIKLLAKVTFRGVPVSSVNSGISTLFTRTWEKKATCILMRLCSGYFACVIDNSLSQDNTNRNDLTSQNIKYLGPQ